MTKLARIVVGLVAATTLALLGLAVATTAQAGSTFTTPSAGDPCEPEGAETDDAVTGQAMVCAENDKGELVWTILDEDPEESPTPTPSDSDDGDDDSDDDDDGDNAPTPTPVETDHPVTG